MKANKSNSGLGLWIVVGVIVAALAVGIIYYIGWFDTRNHVDTPAGDNVLKPYTIEMPDSAAPAEVDWENPDSASLREIITNPDQKL